MVRDTLEAPDRCGNTITTTAEPICLSVVLARLARQSHAARLEKARIELRAELGRIPSELETWVEFQFRHPVAAHEAIASVLLNRDGEAGA